MAPSSQRRTRLVCCGWRTFPDLTDRVARRTAARRLRRPRNHRQPPAESTIARCRGWTGKQRALQSMAESRDWERHFRGDATCGRDPSQPIADESGQVYHLNQTGEASRPRGGSHATSFARRDTAVRNRADRPNSDCDVRSGQGGSCRRHRAVDQQRDQDHRGEQRGEQQAGSR